MAFPNSFEAKVSSINSTGVKTEVHVRVYQVTDGGIVDGQQQYSRTLFRDLNLTFDAGWDAPRIRAALLTRLTDLNTQFSLNYTADKFLCNVG
jgi:hypothetical protein